jgi:hypothetical protein|nr:MAG TPA: hypothetical protein [Caudoviricetes sp.]
MAFLEDIFMFKFNEHTRSHMPFIAHGNASDFTPKKFCCLWINGKWKLHHYDKGEWIRINTGLPSDATECSPTAEYDDEKWKVSFVAGGHESDRRFYLYKIADLENPVSEKIIRADVGFISKNRIVYAGRDGGLFISNENNVRKLDFTGVEFLYRVSFNPNNPNELLISGQDKGGKLFSWACNTSAKTLHELCNGNEAAYKAAMFNGVCYYATCGDDYEDRRIVEAAKLVKTPLNFADIVKIDVFENSPTNLQMLQNFTKATFRWAKAGFAVADENTLFERKAICDKCEFWFAKARMGLGKCVKCGCSSAKLKFASEKCPLDKW